MEEKDKFDSSVSSGAARYNTFLSYDDKKTNNELMDASKYWNKGHIQRLVKDKYVVVAGKRGREHEYLINEKKLPRPGERKTNPSTQPQAAVIGEEILSERQFTEGKAIQVLVNRYERDKQARDACLRIHKPICKCCGFNSEDTYGAGILVIHVHHNKMLSTVGPDYRPDPRTDLSPVCPNCHAVIHSADPPHSIEAVRLMLNSTDRS
jgi:predicted HNH restriction endonuclease